MAEKWFLALDGIPGGSTDAAHPHEIDVQSWSWGLGNPSSHGSGGGGGAGRASFEDLQLLAPLSVASPRLFLACAAGTHVARAVLTGVQAGQEPLDLLVVRLHDVLVSAYRIGDDGLDAPKDRFSLAFGRIEVQYTPRDMIGNAGPAVAGGWDVRQNTGF